MTISTVDPLRAALELAREICDGATIVYGNLYFYVDRAELERLRDLLRQIPKTAKPTINPGQIGECSECGAAYYNESDIGFPCQIRHCRGRVVRNRKQGGEQT